MANGARRVEQEMRIDFAVLPETKSQGLFHQIHKEVTSYDELGLDKLGDELSALFVIISDTDATFNFLVAIMYSQLFNLLCTKADNSEGGKLTYHVRCLLDEFANIGEIPQFEKLRIHNCNKKIECCVRIRNDDKKCRQFVTQLVKSKFIVACDFKYLINGKWCKTC